MGNQGTNSNGHGEGKEESMNLVETINIWKMMSIVIKLIMRGL